MPYNHPTEKQTKAAYFRLRGYSGSDALRLAGYAESGIASPRLRKCTKIETEMKRLKSKLEQMMALNLAWANDPDAIKKRIAARAELTKSEQTELRALELLGRSNAMFTDRNLNENRNIDVTDIEDKRRIAAQALRMLEQAEQAGASLAQLGEVEVSTPKPQHDEGLDSTAQAYEDKTVTPDTV